jgi:nucleotide-binding universal stress UspA family protein
MSIEKIAVALSLEEKLLEPLYKWGTRFEWSNIKEVNFFHIIKKNVTPLEFGLVELPDEKTIQSMKPTLDQFIREEAKKIIPQAYQPEIKIHIWGDFHPKERAIEFLQNSKVNLVVCSTRGLHGARAIFQSSFADHLIKFAPCDVLVVRPA